MKKLIFLSILLLVLFGGCATSKQKIPIIVSTDIVEIDSTEIPKNDFYLNCAFRRFMLYMQMHRKCGKIELEEFLCDYSNLSKRAFIVECRIQSKRAAEIYGWSTSFREPPDIDKCATIDALRHWFASIIIK